MKLQQVSARLRKWRAARRLLAEYHAATTEVAHELAAFDTWVTLERIAGYSLNTYAKGVTVDVHANGVTYRYASGFNALEALREANDHLLDDLRGDGLREHWWDVDALET